MRPTPPESASGELPPRTRRILGAALSDRNDVGTTSAYAENTAMDQAQPHDKRNYLRVRGEYSCVARRIIKSGELPPRTRRIPPLAGP